jgi:lysophospholipase L1-like esterase
MAAWSKALLALAVVGFSAGGDASVVRTASAAETTAGVASHCRVPDGLMESHPPLPLTTARLNAGMPLTIVAIGSSSTAGAGASHPGASYPARLNNELDRRFPTSSITVVNRGVGGDTARRMIARFHGDVTALNPHLVIWQIGTNSALRDHDPAQFHREIAEGIRLLRQGGADVILMAPQFAPRFNHVPNRMAFVQAVNDVAAETDAVLFPRHAIMKYWIESGRFDFKAMLSPDGLHLNDLSYDCIAQLLAEQIETIVHPQYPARSTR